MRLQANKRYRIEYRGANGKFSSRVIKVIKHSAGKVVAWCEKRNAMRTFQRSRIEDVMVAR